ncbi:MAG: hypothetical protein ABSA02_12750 [Trebonia sp.]|jgi:hypothetical protein
MSSAILYLAIIAIWLCVLIPRWLKRDSARGAALAPDAAAAGGTPVTAAAGDGETDLADDGTAQADDHDATPRPSAPAPRALPAAPLSKEETRRRVLAGRRRLLGMLVALEIAAIALAFLGLAALWVVVPPSIMLTGYVLLLREAAAADADRAKREAEAAAHARERERAARARARAAQRVTPAEGTPIEPASVAAALAAKFAAAPVPADYEESGRDFAPGLAGKYTTSNADHEPEAEDYTYEPPRLRAVGD